MTLTKNKKPSIVVKSSTESIVKEISKHSEPLHTTTVLHTCNSQSSKSIPWSRSNICDSGLQPTTKRRRYMRRGSRCPSMFMVVPIANESTTSTSSCSSIDMDYIMNGNESQCNSTKQSDLSLPCGKPVMNYKSPSRRMSMMSALKISLERISMRDTPGAQERRIAITPEERRKSTYELLSQI